LAKVVSAEIKIQISAGKATPAPPIGPALGPHGLNLMEFCKQFNAKTQAMGDTIIPVIITVYKDRTFTFVTKTPPASELIKKAAGILKGSGVPNKEKVGVISSAVVLEIAATKMPDINAYDVQAAALMIAGTARSMGVDIKD
jgi:large subunit ribosomal protein L11